MNASQRARDEQLIAAMTVILTAGHTIEDGEGELRMWGTATGGFLVTNEHADADVTVREEFDDVRAAVAFYLDLCDGVAQPM